MVLARQVALRTEPHADQAITLVLEAGDEVRVAEFSDRWARIVHPRGGGWTERAGVGLVE